LKFLDTLNFYRSKIGRTEYIRIILEELGHEQPPTPLQTDNAMADGLINGKVQPKITKAMDMRFHWLRDQECQQQFLIHWQTGKLNYYDYWEKHHLEAHHAIHRSQNVMNRATKICSLRAA
jgi:hypothetical protein